MFPPSRDPKSAEAHTVPGTWTDRLAWPTLAVVVMIWLGPVGPGGMVPVGGDLTRFQFGLMSHFSDALANQVAGLDSEDQQRADPLVWNDRWGFGFPALAESQMGVFSPVHQFLFRIGSVEAAISWSLWFHTLLAATGAYWLARGLGIGPWGSCVSGLAWTASGFFLIHLTHQWAAATACWTPWILGLGWRILVVRVSQDRGWNDASGWRSGLESRLAVLLALAVALQITPGHFQLAFQTLIGLGLMAVWITLDSGGGGNRLGIRLQRLLKVGLGTAGGLVLATAQLGPTWRLAEQAQATRTVEYLSEFCLTPLHLINLIAPRLFHDSALWRPVAWDPFHTSPEECLAYVGVIPLILALGGLMGWIRSRAVRVATVWAVVGTALSLGPHLPGFVALLELPGFSLFRAPARWTALGGLGLALLAGFGFDRIRLVPSSRRLLAGGGVAMLVMVGLTVILVMWTLKPPPRDTSRDHPVARLVNGLLARLPWSQTIELTELRDRAHRPQDRDPRVREWLACQGIAQPNAGDLTLAERLDDLIARETLPTALLLVALVTLGLILDRHPRILSMTLVVLTILELLRMSAQEPLQTPNHWTWGPSAVLAFEPIGPPTLVERSPVLSLLAREAAGRRVWFGDARNLPLAAGAAPVEAYRTLDLPSPPPLSLLEATGALGDSAALDAVARLYGVSHRVLDPRELAARPPDHADSQTHPPLEVIDDPHLASWLFGRAWATLQPRHAQFGILRLARADEPLPIAWRIDQPLDDVAKLLETNDPRVALDLVAQAQPIEQARVNRYAWLVDANIGAKSCCMLITRTFDPAWRIELNGTPAPSSAIRTGLGGWTLVPLSGPGPWTFEARYDPDLSWDPRTIKSGRLVSLLALILGVMGLARPSWLSLSCRSATSAGLGN